MVASVQTGQIRTKKRFDAIAAQIIKSVRLRYLIPLMSNGTFNSDFLPKDIPQCCLHRC